MCHLRPCEYVLSEGGGKQLGGLYESRRFISISFLFYSLENNPPVPTLQPGHNPLHRFLGFNPNNHLLSMSARDPNDGREMPPNGHSHMSVNTLRGVRKVRADFFLYIQDCGLIIYTTFISYLPQIGVHMSLHVNLISSFLFPIPPLRILHILKKDLRRVSNVHLHGYLTSSSLTQNAILL